VFSELIPVVCLQDDVGNDDKEEAEGGEELPVMYGGTKLAEAVQLLFPGLERLQCGAREGLGKWRWVEFLEVLASSRPALPLQHLSRLARI
jgi:hypothetical protein